MYTVTLAYLGERVKITELSIATSVFIIIFEFGEFVGPITIGFIMDKYENTEFEPAEGDIPLGAVPPALPPPTVMG